MSPHHTWSGGYDIKIGDALDFIWVSHDSLRQFLQENQQSFYSLVSIMKKLCGSTPSSKHPAFQFLLLCFL